MKTFTRCPDCNGPLHQDDCPLPRYRVQGALWEFHGILYVFSDGCWMLPIDRAHSEKLYAARTAYFEQGGVESDLGPRNDPSWYWRRAVKLLCQQRDALQKRGTELVLRVQTQGNQLTKAIELVANWSRDKETWVYAAVLAEALHLGAVNEVADQTALLDDIRKMVMAVVDNYVWGHKLADAIEKRLLATAALGGTDKTMTFDDIDKLHADLMYLERLKNCPDIEPGDLQRIDRIADRVKLAHKEIEHTNRTLREIVRRWGPDGSSAEPCPRVVAFIEREHPKV